MALNVQFQGLNESEKLVKKCLKSILKTVKNWQETQKLSNEILDSLMHLHEQITCCEEATFSKEFLHGFPDIKKRLLYKITKCLDEKMKKLREVIKAFESFQDTLEKIQVQFCKIYMECSDNVDLVDLCRGSAKAPPMTLIYEWIIDITTFYSNLCEEKKDLVNNVRYNDKMYMKALTQKWQENSSLVQIKGAIEEVKMFVNHSQNEA